MIISIYKDRYLEEMIDAAPTGFCVGVAGYPERHFEAPNLSWDVQNLKRKIEAGASYVVTQMFFDNDHYFGFVERCRAEGITVPIVPGLKILTSKRHIKSLPGNFHVEVPEALAAEAEAAQDQHVTAVGIDWASRQAIELLDAGVKYLHFYIMSTSRHVNEVVRRIRKSA